MVKQGRICIGLDWLAGGQTLQLSLSNWQSRYELGVKFELDSATGAQRKGPRNRPMASLGAGFRGLDVANVAGIRAILRHAENTEHVSRLVGGGGEI